MKTFKAVLLSLIVLLTGCAAPVHNYSPTRIEISEPSIGEVNIANIGDNMVRQGIYTEHAAIYVENDTPVGLLHPYTITKGFFLKFGEDENSAFFSIQNSFEGGGTLTKAALADPRKAVQAYKNESKLCGVSVFNAAACATDVNYRFTSKVIQTADSSQQMLIYNGKFGTRIRVGYREFSADMARQAFSNDVEYDLSESRTIGYKGALIEVLEATNEYIRYKLLKNFNVTN